MFIAEREGLLDRQGIVLDKLLASTGNAIMQALASSSLDMALSAPDTAILAVEQGASLSMVAGGYNRLVYTLVTHPSITSVPALQGKAVGVSGIKASDALILRRMLQHAGLKDDDYDLIVASTSNDRLAALRTGTIGGAVLAQPVDFQAADEGFRLLAKSTDVVQDYQFTLMLANRPWARDHEDAVVRVVRAYSEAARWIHDPANKERAIAILAEATQTQPEIARKTYELFIDDVKALSTDGSINMPGLETVIEVLHEAGSLNPPLPPASKYVDDSYLQKARTR
jgi:ABC-type nitrate/sulfonate/bicarbonate transport system substrate-binding protein